MNNVDIEIMSISRILALIVLHSHLETGSYIDQFKFSPKLKSVTCENGALSF